MANKIKTLLIVTTSLALVACAEQTENSNFGNEAGSWIDEGSFGNPTMNNTLIQTGQMPFLDRLSQRFSDEVPSTVNFPFASAKLTSDAQAVLRTQASWIRQFPEVWFKVYGHTDLVGPESYNEGLGRQRADAVVNYLVSQGVNRKRLVAVVSYGESQPLVATEGREVRNRRAVTEVSGFVQGHPSVLDGKYAAVIYREYVGSSQQVQTGGEGGLDVIDAGGG